jgi:threonine 3-dehydrogenase
MQSSLLRNLSRARVGVVRYASGAPSRAESAKLGRRAPKILVTGAVGQVGQELVPFLRQLKGKENVIASDMRAPPTDMYEAGPFAYVDVLDSSAMAKLIVEENVDTVVHLAALLSAVGEKNPDLALKVNNVGTQNVFELAKIHALKVFCPSTIAVFGPSTPMDNTPDDCILRPTTMYGLTKIHTELLGEYYHRKFGVDFRSIRYPGVISYKTMPGGGTTDYAVEIYHEALAKGEFTCFLRGDSSLPMIYMPDLLKATVKMMDAPEESLTRRVYNLGSMAFTPEVLAESIRKEIPEFKINYNVDFRQDIADTWPNSIDDSLAARDWGWKPDYDIDRMTRHMLEFLGAARLEKGLPRVYNSPLPEKK